MKVGYKESVLGEIPMDWEALNWDDVCEICYGKDQKSVQDENGIYGIYGTGGLMAMTNSFLCDKPSVMIGRKGTIDKPFYLDRPFWTVDTLYYTKTNDNIDTKWFYYSVLGTPLIKYNEATGVPSLSRANLYKIKVAVPPLPEQQKIAEILSTVDSKIDLIEQQIAECTQLKKGLMQKLLSKGIGHTEFKDSALGMIPRSWEVKLLEDCAKRGSGHTPDKKMKDYYNGGVKWVSLGDSNKLDKRYISETKIEISKEGLKNSSAVIHPKETVLLSRDAGVGKSAIMKTEMAVSQHFITWECDINFNNWFLYYNLQVFKPTFERVAIGSTIKTIGLGFFKKMKIVVPPIKEQIKIADILNSVDEKLDILLEKKTIYLELKQGLMQQLLTGKVRVAV